MRKTYKDKSPEYKYSKVMLIDDNELDNFINQKVIEAHFFSETVYVNTSGLSALEFLKNISLDNELKCELMPEVIFIDINMPFMDGFQFIDHLISLPSVFVDNVKLVVLTSSINPEDKTKAESYSKKIFYLNKPLTDESLNLI